MSRLEKLKREAINEANKRVLGEQSESLHQKRLREIKECLESIGYKEDDSAYKQNANVYDNKGNLKDDEEYYKNTGIHKRRILKTPVGPGTRQLFMRKKSTFGNYETLAISNSEGEFKFFVIDKEKMPQLPGGFQPFSGMLGPQGLALEDGSWARSYALRGGDYPFRWEGDCEKFKKIWGGLESTYGGEQRDLLSRIYAAKKDPDAWEEFKKEVVKTGKGFKKMGEAYVEFWKLVGETAWDWVTK